jgi:hypothetical protein
MSNVHHNPWDGPSIREPFEMAVEEEFDNFSN